MLVVGKIVASLLFPPGIFIILALLGAFLGARGWRKSMVIVLALDAALIYALSTNLISNVLLRPLEDAFLPLSSPADARAIVVLGGGFNESSPEYGGEGSLSIYSEKRAAYGLELSREFGLPLVYSGGRAYDSSWPGSEAEAALRLWLALGVPQNRITLETESEDTRGNARGVKKGLGAGPFVLVTSAAHMPRAMLAFRKAGLRVIAAPTDYRAKRTPATFSDFLPDTGALNDSRFALHEFLGLLYYFMT